MDLENGIRVRDKKTQDFLEEMRKKDEGIYFKEGLVFRKDSKTGKVEALGTIAEFKPEKCRECAFLIKNPSSRDALSLDGDLFYKGGCILKECVEGIIRERRSYTVSQQQLTPHFRRIHERNMWRSRQK